MSETPIYDAIHRSLWPDAEDRAPSAGPGATAGDRAAPDDTARRLGDQVTGEVATEPAPDALG